MTDQATKLRQRMEELKLNEGRPSSFKGRSIAVVSGKGGVGKTNFSVNFALTLAEHGQKVMLLDMDVGMGNVHLLLNASPPSSMGDYLLGYEPFERVIYSYDQNLSFIAGGSQLDEVLEWNESMIHRLLNAFEVLEAQYDYIIFDMGAGATERTLDFIEAVDDVIVIATEEPTSITDAYSMMKFLTLRDPTVKISIVANRVMNMKTPLAAAERLQFAMRKFLRKKVYVLGYLEEDEVVRRAVIARSPFVIYSPNASVSYNIRSIVNQYLGVVPRREKKKSLLHSLKRWFQRG